MNHNEKQILKQIEDAKKLVISLSDSKEEAMKTLNSIDLKEFDGIKKAMNNMNSNDLNSVLSASKLVTKEITKLIKNDSSNSN